MRLGSSWLFALLVIRFAGLRLVGLRFAGLRLVGLRFVGLREIQNPVPTKLRG